ncbi:MAG: hypothetical protein WCX64_03250 [Candidatus Micrarchaeia archaeon]|jgi:hypothetical protein
MPRLGRLPALRKPGVVFLSGREVKEGKPQSFDAIKGVVKRPLSNLEIAVKYRKLHVREK